MSAILSGPVEQVVENSRPHDAERSVPHYAYDASLLFHRMNLHQVDRAYLADRDPLLFYELQARCALCPSKEQCAADHINGALSEAARAYCVNAETLVALSEQPQKIALPRADAAPVGPQPYYYIGSKGGVVPHWWAEGASRVSQAT